MPFAIAAALFAIGAPLAAVNFFAVAIGGSLLLTLGFNVAVGIGLSLAANALFRPTLPTGAVQKPSDGQQTVRQAVPPRWKHYGKVRISGPLFWFESDVPNKDLYIGLALNQGRISSFEELHIDDNTVLVDGAGLVTTAPYSTVVTKIVTRLGVDPETAYSEIATAFGFTNIRGDGVATMLGVFRTFSAAESQQENYPNSLPKLRTTIKASVVWDPRDKTQIRTDESTWLWSENPPICLLDYMLSVDGFGIDYERIEPALADWIVAADICDEQIWSIEGRREENRYICAATYLLTDAPKDVLARLAETFDGRVWQRRDGAITVTAGKFFTPDVTLKDDAILGFSLERGLDRLNAAAGIRAQYMEPANDYRETDATPWPDAATVAALTDERVINQDYTWTPSHGQARRLMERSHGRAQAGWRGQVITSLSGLHAIDERVVDAEHDMRSIAYMIQRLAKQGFEICLGHPLCQLFREQGCRSRGQLYRILAYEVAFALDLVEQLLRDLQQRIHLIARIRFKAFTRLRDAFRAPFLEGCTAGLRQLALPFFLRFRTPRRCIECPVEKISCWFGHWVPNRQVHRRCPTC